MTHDRLLAALDAMATPLTETRTAPVPEPLDYPAYIREQEKQHRKRIALIIERAFDGGNKC